MPKFGSDVCTEDGVCGMWLIVDRCVNRRIGHAKQIYTFSANDVKPDRRSKLPLVAPLSCLLFGLKQVDKQRHGHLTAKVKTARQTLAQTTNITTIIS